MTIACFRHFLCLCKNIERHCQRLESGIVVTIEDTLVGQVGLSDSYILVIEESSDAADPLTSLVCHPEEVGFVKPTAAALCLKFIPVLLIISPSMFLST